MMASRRSHRENIAAARGPSLPPPAAWNTSACVSVTAASDSATAAGPFRNTISRSRFLHHQRTTKRRVEEDPQRGVRLFERRIARIDVDRADHRPGRADLTGCPGGAHDLIEQFADAPESSRSGPPFEPREILRVEGH